MEQELAFKASDLMPIVTAVAALLGVYITNLAQERRAKMEFRNKVMLQERELKREKLEEMHTLFQKWELDVSGLYLIYISVYQGKYSAEEAMELSQKNRLQEKGDQQRFQTLMQLYFPDLEIEYNFVFEERGKALAYCKPDGEFKRADLKNSIQLKRALKHKQNYLDSSWRKK
ncbi:hypothetical protein QNZ79_004554 [Vibrio parahaemolyticus]|uniref:hypothetical protein n=1 Tax=Vibrio parahaemolyticus TaxID=670 RepID=UPI0009B7055A|nr:hypothetical protein [Vibrio parahaemolyticus]ELB2259634.1 hypothetical protein [Vibrio parahaemolyticus]OQK29187.1 putative membrane protein [Vibrio parahaemolyticus]